MPKFKIPAPRDLALVKFKLECAVHVPMLGEVVDIKLSGLRDDDDDGNPEVAYDIEILNKDLVKPGSVEVPLSVLLMSIEGIVAPIVSAALGLAK